MGKTEAILPNISLNSDIRFSGLYVGSLKQLGGYVQYLTVWSLSTAIFAMPHHWRLPFARHGLMKFTIWLARCLCQRVGNVRPKLSTLMLVDWRDCYKLWIDKSLIHGFIKLLVPKCLAMRMDCATSGLRLPLLLLTVSLRWRL